MATRKQKGSLIPFTIHCVDEKTAIILQENCLTNARRSGTVINATEEEFVARYFRNKYDISKGAETR